MNEHHQELLQTVAHISHEYNEVQELLQTKQKMVADETTRSMQDVNQYFDSYIDELRATQLEITTGISKAKEDAEVCNNSAVRGEARAYP